MDWEQQALFIFIVNVILIFSGMVVFWIINILTKNMGIVDIGWVLGIFTVSLTCFLWGPGNPMRRVLLVGLVGLWAYRLGTYLLLRFLKSKEEDKRYKQMRNQWTSYTELKILAMFLFQGLLILLLTLPFMAIAFDNQPIHFLDIVGISIATIAILFEAVADWQLRQFKQDHPGQVCRIGLWSRSRHPNYFFEWVFWIGIACFALQAPFGLTGVFSCGLILILLLYVSGISLTEKVITQSKNPDYVKYQKEVPGFFPRLF